VRPASALGLALGFGGLAMVAQPSFSTRAPGGIGTATAVLPRWPMIGCGESAPNESIEPSCCTSPALGLVVMSWSRIPGWRTPDSHQALLLLAGTGLCGGAGQLTMNVSRYALDRAARVRILSYSGLVFNAMLASHPLLWRGSGPRAVFGFAPRHRIGTWP